MSSVDWEALRDKVTRRDHFMTFCHQPEPMRSWSWWLMNGSPCVAPILDRTVDACSGRITLDHVKDQPYIGDPIKKRTDKHSHKAPDDEHHLVSLCWHHHLDGWATAHRPILRDYLIQFKEVSPYDRSTIH